MDAIRHITYEELDRMFFEPLRKAVVAAGFLPDVTQYANAKDYMAAKQAIRNSGKQIIEIFGPGTPVERDDKTSSRIVIDRTNQNRGDIGASGLVGLEPYFDTSGNQRYRQYLQPDSTKHVKYHIRTVADTTKYDRILCDLVNAVLHSRRSMRTIDADGNYTDNWVVVQYSDDFDLAGINFTERIFTFVVRDVFVEPAEAITSGSPSGTIVPLTTVNVRFKLPGGIVVDRGDPPLVSVLITPNGDLTYNNNADPDTTLALDADGDLVADGPYVNQYKIDESGDLVYETIK